MDNRSKLIVSFAILVSLLFFPTNYVRSQDEEPITGTVTIQGADILDPIITSVIVNDDLVSPFDQIAYDFSNNIIWYSNIKTSDSVLNITVTATDDLQLASFNTSREWSDGENITVSGTSESVQFNYTISNGETSSGNLTLEVYDAGNNKAQYFINVTLDNTAPNEFEIELLFTTAVSCGFVNTTVEDLQSGFYGVTLIAQGVNESFDPNFYSVNRTFTTNGINKFCVKEGLYSISALAYDNVGNQRNATNSGFVFLQFFDDEEPEKPKNFDNWLADILAGETALFFLLIPLSFTVLLLLAGIKRIWRKFL